MADVFVSITDQRQPGKVTYDLVELLVAVNTVLVGVGTLVQTLGATGTQANIARAIHRRGTDYILAVKRNPRSISLEYRRSIQITRDPVK